MATPKKDPEIQNDNFYLDHSDYDLFLDDEDDFSDDFDSDWTEDPWTDEDDAALEEWEETRRARLAEKNEY